MRSSFSRLFVAASIILLAALLLVGLCFNFFMEDFLTETTVEDLTADGELIAELVEAHVADGQFKGLDFSMALTAATRVSGADAVVFDNDGCLILCADQPFGCQHQGLRLTDENYLSEIYEKGSATSTGIIAGLYEEERYIVCLPVTDSQTGIRLGVVMVSTPTERTVQILNQISKIFGWVSLVVTGICAIAMTFLARRESRPLREMAKAAVSFGHGDLNARVRTGGGYPEEVEELALAFNNMATSLQKSEYQRQEFVANVSHELKTPMTTISGYVDGILDGTIPPQRHRYYLQIVSDETKRLSRLVRSMLDISRLHDQGGIPEDRKSRFDLEEAMGQVLITFEQKINGKALNVEVEMPEHPVYTFANPDSITQVIYNLLDNAVKFCPRGGNLGLRIREGGGKAYVSVSNNGRTIPPEELPLVFDRFHKLDKSRSQNRDGWGLGLYIVKTIVCSHGENISVTSKDDVTEFTFTLPLVT